jgi:hypothetical protein
MKQSIASTYFREQYGANRPPENPSMEQAQEVDRRFRLLLTQLVNNARADLTSTVKLVTEHGFGHLQEVIDMTRVSVVVGSDVISQGVDALLYAMVTGAWTNFETLAAELWEAAVNAHPKSLAHLSGSPRDRFKLGKSLDVTQNDIRKTITLDDLGRFDYAISDKMGTIHIEARKVAFDSLSGIRHAYALAFAKDATKIDAALRADALDLASQIRHVIVHRAGKIDDSYLKKTKHIAAAPRGEQGCPIELDGEIVSSILRGLLECGKSLCTSVDAWLKAH